MPTTALLLALAAAFVHALWNILLARAPDVESATAVALVTAEVVFLPVALLTWDVEASVWPYILAGGVLQITYFALLSTAYRLVPLSGLSPIARGGAAPFVVLVGGVGLGHPAGGTPGG